MLNIKNKNKLNEYNFIFNKEDYYNDCQKVKKKYIFTKRMNTNTHTHLMMSNIKEKGWIYRMQRNILNFDYRL